MAAESETGYRCPECGWTESFELDSAIMHIPYVEINEGSWDYSTEGSEIEVPEGAHMTCGNRECGHTGPYGSFMD